ncbi:hypothetical protein GCM10018987_17320 [Streptomyces cremeus]
MTSLPEDTAHRLACALTCGCHSDPVSSTRAAWTFSSAETGVSTRCPTSRFAPSFVQPRLPVRWLNGGSSICAHRSLSSLIEARIR